MAKLSDHERLGHMLCYARTAQRISINRTRTDLDTDEVFSLAIVRALEVIGEAANRVSPQGRAKAPTILWPQIIALRNRIIHGYDLVDRDLIWEVVTRDLAPLIADLENAIGPSGIPSVLP